MTVTSDSDFKVTTFFDVIKKQHDIGAAIVMSIGNYMRSIE